MLLSKNFTLADESLLQHEDPSLNILTSEKVLSKTIPWINLRTGDIIKPRDLELIQKYDHKPIKEKLELFNQFGKDYAILFLSILDSSAQTETLQYVVTLIEEILSEDDKQANLFLKLKDPADPNTARLPLGPLYKLLMTESNDWYLVSKVCWILAVLNYKNRDIDPKDTEELFQWINLQIRTKQNPLEISTALGALQILLRKDELRETFYNNDGLNNVSGLIKTYAASNSTAAFQILYQATYALWLLSYNSVVSAKFGENQVIMRLGGLIRTSVKEKVIRMAIACLRNLVNKGSNNEEMIECNIVKEIDKLTQRKWADEDVIADLDVINQSLQKNMVELSSFTIYKQELFSGELEWSPVHKSEKFWRENHKNFEENNNKPLHVLVNLLRPSSKPLVLAVACYDIGEFVRFHPQGRQLLQNLGAKEMVMSLMNHDDPEVQKQALLSLQKMMVHNWEYLTR
eukprot:TRINITY_DN10076_c0_g1_i1.p1 TRINITY_DN10076_c0_g1~~TRINITY_DN10076_c0_g1_i1.p1  ORF type:complete len:460 (-),score=85.02 TRINITY_DN10076_c0_g1_i1:105-1484(-)